MTNPILHNYIISESEWAQISHLFPVEPEPSPKGGGRYIPNRVTFQAALYWLCDGLARARVKTYTGVCYDTLASRVDE